MQATIKRIRESIEGLYPESEITALTRIIILHLTGSSIPAILSDKSRKISTEEKNKIEEIINRLKEEEPIQYILGETEFYGLPFIVDKNVLIPRPETEELIELILKEKGNESPHSILDIGTGSGCIAIVLKKQLNDSSVHAWDISHEAISVAEENAKKNNATVKFERVDVLNEYPQETKYDVIVSNPPYVLESEKKEMENNVLRYEPHSALFVSDDNALLFYERIADIAARILKQQGRLYFEINSQKGQEVTEMLAQKGFKKISLLKDLSGKDRIVKAVY